MDRPMEDRGVLHALRQQGNWVAVRTDTLRGLVECWIASGKEITQEVATADLVYWMDKGLRRGYRYYARRWGWGERRVRTLMESLGIYRRPQGAGTTLAGQPGGADPPPIRQT